jgi:class 3 adenylate cyclase
LIEKYGVEKIGTIGDDYMIASGLPQPRNDHAQILARLALEMNAYIFGLPPVGGQSLSFRLGMNSGPAIAGVIGQKKFAYNVWGDSVNVASRMESQGVPGKIQITQATYELIRDSFHCEPRGTINIKGRGEMMTWFLMGTNG